MTDTDEKYLGDEFYVTMAGDLPPEFVTDVMEERHRESVEDPDSPLVGPPDYTPSPRNDHHAINPDVPVDGWVTFYDPALLESGDAFKHGTFPFRSVEKDGPWFARPDGEKWSRSPVWKWENPDADPHESLTLSPSIGLGDPLSFHCFIRDGGIEWL